MHLILQTMSQIYSAEVLKAFNKSDLDMGQECENALLKLCSCCPLRNYFPQCGLSNEELSDRKIAGPFYDIRHKFVESLFLSAIWKFRMSIIDSIELHLVPSDLHWSLTFQNIAECKNIAASRISLHIEDLNKGNSVSCRDLTKAIQGEVVRNNLNSRRLS